MVRKRTLFFVALVISSCSRGREAALAEASSNHVAFVRGTSLRRPGCSATDAPRALKSASFGQPQNDSFHVDDVQENDLDRRHNGVMYRQSIFSEEELETIRTEIQPLLTALQDEASSIAQLRRSAVIPPSSKTIDILSSPNRTMMRMIHRLAGSDYRLTATDSLPVEVRVYDRIGACMAWHVDDVLFHPPQIEAVITIENTSDCVTMWEGGSQETDPNSVLLLRAGGPSHCVTSLRRGRRIILKCIYASEHAEMKKLEDSMEYKPPKRTIKLRRNRRR